MTLDCAVSRFILPHRHRQCAGDDILHSHLFIVPKLTVLFSPAAPFAPRNSTLQLANDHALLGNDDSSHHCDLFLRRSLSTRSSHQRTRPKRHHNYTNFSMQCSIRMKLPIHSGNADDVTCLALQTKPPSWSDYYSRFKQPHFFLPLSQLNMVHPSSRKHRFNFKEKGTIRTLLGIKLSTLGLSPPEITSLSRKIAFSPCSSSTKRSTHGIYLISSSTKRLFLFYALNVMRKTSTYSTARSCTIRQVKISVKTFQLLQPTNHALKQHSQYASYPTRAVSYCRIYRFTLKPPYAKMITNI